MIGFFPGMNDWKDQNIVFFFFKFRLYPEKKKKKKLSQRFWHYIRL